MAKKHPKNGKNLVLGVIPRRFGTMEMDRTFLGIFPDRPSPLENPEKKYEKLPTKIPGKPLEDIFR